METRIGRIERYIEEFAKGMLELKESQKKRDAQQDRTDEQILKLKESQKQTDAQIMELKEAQKKTDAQLNRTDAQLNQTIKKLDDIGVNLGNMGIVQGEVAEDDVGRYAEKSGLFVLTQTSDGGAALMNRKNFRPKEFS